MSEPEEGAEMQEPPPRCLNCDARLLGQYCGNCGQRAQGRFISVWELVRDAVGDLMDVDSRLWRTLYLLAFRPGRLTSEYLQGRRARYMPPFRTYLVLSLVFFFVAFFDPGNFSILFEPSAEAPTTAKDKIQLNQEDREKLTEELAREGIFIGPNAAGREAESGGLSIDLGDGEVDCEIQNYDPTKLPGWLGRRLTRERVKETCERLMADVDSGMRGLFQRLIELIPAGLFVLLPLMAVVLKLLYPLSRRFYVEHLLMVINFHSFVFLTLTVQTLLSRFGEWLRLPDAFMEILVLSIVIYIPVYLYKSLRRVYGQRHLWTTWKYLLLIMTYSAGLSLMLMIAMIFAVFQA